MIAVWNRKEVLITYDMRTQSEVRTLLHDHGISYMVKSGSHDSRTGSGRAHLGGVLPNPAAECEYKIYVHKDDYEKAVRLINRRS